MALIKEPWDLFLGQTSASWGRSEVTRMSVHPPNHIQIIFYYSIITTWAEMTTLCCVKTNPRSSEALIEMFPVLRFLTLSFVIP